MPVFGELEPFGDFPSSGLAPSRLPGRIVQLRAGLPNLAGRLWTGPLVINADVTLTSSNKPNKAKIDIMNLSRESVQFLEQPGILVELLAGEGLAGLVFRGELRGLSDVRSILKPGGRVTTLEPQDGRREWLTTYITRSWPVNTTNRQILTDAFAAMGLGVGYISPALPTKVFATAYTWRGPPRGIVNDLLTPVGAKWNHAGGVVNVIMPGETMPGNVPVLSSATGMIGSPKRKGKTITVESLFNGLIRPNGGIQVEAREVQGLFRVDKVRHRPDSRGIIWRSMTDAVKP